MSRFTILFLALSFIFSSYQCSTAQGHSNKGKEIGHTKDLSHFDIAYFASGCFWCAEAVFESVKGVEEVISGYSGGNESDANYKDVSAGVTDHAEAIAVYYDPRIISYETLLIVFFGSHDPTTLNKQGPDAGRQYRSEIYYRNESEKGIAEAYVNFLLKENVFSKITTLITSFDSFYSAEDYHQNYEKLNPNQPYVRAVSIPRLRKFQKAFPDLLK